MLNFQAGFSGLFPRLRAALRAAALVLPLLLTTAATTQSAETQPRAHVYLFNGILGVFFSTGMQEIADQLQAEGYQARTYGPSEWRHVADRAMADYRKGETQAIIFVGYSAGVASVNDAVARLSEAGVPVRLAIALDSLKPRAVSGNVGRYINFYSSTDGAKPVAKGAGFSGAIQTVDLNSIAEVNHENVDDNAAVQAKIIGAIRGAL